MFADVIDVEGTTAIAYRSFDGELRVYAREHSASNRRVEIGSAGFALLLEYSIFQGICCVMFGYHPGNREEIGAIPHRHVGSSH